jgi:general secretion pathway protein B
MSFILDALRKSEHERQRSAVPGVAQVPFAVQRRETPRWALMVIGVLGAAVLGLVGVAWWQTTRDPEPASSARTTQPLDLPPAEATQPPVQAAPRVTRVEPAEPQPRTAERSPPAFADSAAPAPANATAGGSTTAPRSSAAFGTASAPAPADAKDAPLPSAAALAAQGIAVPQLRLTLHGYNDNPADRFVFINGARYREGDTLREGPRVVSIERSGVVLSQQGRRFRLASE